MGVHTISGKIFMNIFTYLVTSDIYSGKARVQKINQNIYCSSFFINASWEHLSSDMDTVSIFFYKLINENVSYMISVKIYDF